MSVKQGNLEFITVKSEKHIRSRSKTLFLFNGEYYKSEYVAIEYFKSKGYDTFFSENTTWKNMLQVLFKDIFEKFEELARRKRYKRYFYDDRRRYERELSQLNKGFCIVQGTTMNSDGELYHSNPLTVKINKITVDKS